MIEVRLPAIITTDLRLNEPRYVSLPGLMKARKKTIEFQTCDQLGVMCVRLRLSSRPRVRPGAPPGCASSRSKSWSSN